MGWKGREGEEKEERGEEKGGRRGGRGRKERGKVASWLLGDVRP